MSTTKHEFETPTVLAMDPGTFESALIYFWADKAVPGGLVIAAKEYLPNREALTRIRTENIAAAVIETPRPRGELASMHLFDTAIWIGRFFQAAEDRELAWGMIFHGDAALTVTGTGRMTDPQCRQALIDRFGGERVAVGGKKCSFCNGRKTQLVGRVPCPVCGVTGSVPGSRAGTTKKCPKCHGKLQIDGGKIPCEHCAGSGYSSPPGPLQNMNNHFWSALAVAVAWLEKPRFIHSITDPKAV